MCTGIAPPRQSRAFPSPSRARRRLRRACATCRCRRARGRPSRGPRFRPWARRCRAHTRAPSTAPAHRHASPSRPAPASSRLGRRRLAVGRAHHLLAHGALADEQRHVRRERAPRRLRQVGRQRQRRAAVVAVHHRGDALQQVAFGRGQFEQPLARVGVGIDEAGRHDEPGRIDARRCRGRARRCARCGRRGCRHRRETGPPVPSTTRPPASTRSRGAGAGCAVRRVALATDRPMSAARTAGGERRDVSGVGTPDTLAPGGVRR